MFRTSDGTQVGTAINSADSTMAFGAVVSADGSHAAFLSASGYLYLNPLNMVILQMT